jgi:hypothetical protein
LTCAEILFLVEKKKRFANSFLMLQSWEYLFYIGDILLEKSLKIQKKHFGRFSIIKSEKKVNLLVKFIYVIFIV